MQLQINKRWLSTNEKIEQIRSSLQQILQF